MDLPQKIRTLRKSKGWKQTELAQIIGTTQQAITSYEKGQRKPPIEKLPALAGAFGITVDELLEEKHLPMKKPIIQRHGNSRIAQVQEYFEKLSEEEQRITLKQIKALAEKSIKSSTDDSEPSKPQ